MRIVMLTPDIAIDRRIILEAKTLNAAGHEIILLAGWEEGCPEYELIDGIKVRRIRYDGLDPRLRWLVVLQGSVIGWVNACSSISMVLWNFVSRVANKAIGAAARATYLFWNLLARETTNTAINLALRGTEWAWNLVARGANKVIGAAARATYLFWVCLARCVNRGVILFSKGLPWLSGITGYELTLARIARYYDADVYHAHDLPMLRPAVFAACPSRAKVVYDAHEFYPEQPRLREDQRRMLRKLEDKFIRSADLIITVNPLLAREMEARYSGIQVDVIQNAFDLPPEFNTECRYDHIRQELGLMKEHILVLYQGYIAEGRNLETVIKGMALVKDPQLVLLIMGYGEYATHLTSVAANAGIENQVRFVPSKPQHELLFYTASADLGLIPYPYGLDLNTHYVSPNKLYEFIAAGLPILTNKLPFVEAVVVPNGFGVAANLQTEESFAQALDNFPFDRLPEFRANLRAHRKEFLWSMEAEHLLSLYASLTEGLDGLPEVGEQLLLSGKNSHKNDSARASETLTR